MIVTFIARTDIIFYSVAAYFFLLKSSFVYTEQQKKMDFIQSIGKHTANSQNTGIHQHIERDVLHIIAVIHI